MFIFPFEWYHNEVELKGNMLNKKEKEAIRDCAKDLYKLIAELVIAGESNDVPLIRKITEKLEGLLDD